MLEQQKDEDCRGKGEDREDEPREADALGAEHSRVERGKAVGVGPGVRDTHIAGW